MTALEIILISVLGVVVVSTFLLYFLNNKKITKAKQKAEEEAKKLKQEQEEKEKKEKEAKEKEKLIPVETENQVVSTASVVETKITEDEVSNSLDAKDIDEKDVIVEDKINKTVEQTEEKPLKEQINELSPKLKTMLFSDILKTKF
ncbi:MAG: hypothetical protein KBT30_02360 [Clostridiales bacterium]|nr:hypothetical protein [Candidatus Apopatousia equi]